MFNKRYCDAIAKFWSEHLFIAHVAHVGTGFGIALILQQYLQGDAFLPVWIGIALLIFSIAAHAWAIMKAKS